MYQMTCNDYNDDNNQNNADMFSLNDKTKMASSGSTRGTLRQHQIDATSTTSTTCTDTITTTINSNGKNNVNNHKRRTSFSSLSPVSRIIDCSDLSGFVSIQSVLSFHANDYYDERGYEHDVNYDGNNGSIITQNKCNETKQILPLQKTTHFQPTKSTSELDSLLLSMVGSRGTTTYGNYTDGQLMKKDDTMKTPPPPPPPPTTTTTSKFTKYLSRIVQTNSFHFAIRIAVLLTASGLFVIVPDYPDGMWVLISVLFVCWFPSLDAASVMEKIYQRLIGTLVGAAAGIGCGLASVYFCDFRANPIIMTTASTTTSTTTMNETINSSNSNSNSNRIDMEQAIFLSICMFLGTFIFVYMAGQWIVGGVPVIQRFSYATILCVLTFCICLLSFATNEDDDSKVYHHHHAMTNSTIITTTHAVVATNWKHGVIRIINVVVGCLLGGIGSITIYSKSTTDVLYEKISRQVRLAGEASEAILQTSANYYGGKICHGTRCTLAERILQEPIESSLRWKFHTRSHSDMTVDSTIYSTGSSCNCSPACVTRDEIARKKCEDAIVDWKATMALFPLIQYDPFTHLSKLSIFSMFRNGEQMKNIISSNSTGNSNTISCSNNCRRSSKNVKKIHEMMARTMDSAFQIQTTIAVLDGMIRNDNHIQYQLCSDRILLLSQIGCHIRRMLMVPLVLEDTNISSNELCTKLELIRTWIRQTFVDNYNDVHATATTPQEYNGLPYEDTVHNEQRCENQFEVGVCSNDFNDFTSDVRTCNDTMNNGIDRDVDDDYFNNEVEEDRVGQLLHNYDNIRRENTLFFLQLVEHLIVRTLRLYQTWKHVEIISRD